MARYLVIENEAKSFELIKEAIEQFDPKSQIEHFTEFRNVELHWNSLPEEKRKDFLNFDLTLIAFGDTPTKEWKKRIDDFRKMDRPATPICLLMYENIGVNLKFLQTLEVYNIIFKPLDPLIMKETIHLALQREKLAKTLEVKSQKATAFIGLLKEVELQSISELGFLTISDAPIPVLSITKYFSPLFEVGRKQSVWAQCLVSAEHPQKPGSYINKFQFYGVKKDFLNQIRRYVAGFKQHETSSAAWNLDVSAKAQRLKLALIAVNNPANQTYKKDIEAHFKNLEVEFLDFALAHEWAGKMDHDLVLNISDLEFDQIKTYFKDGARCFLMANELPDEEKLREMSSQYLEIFMQPYDRGYFYKKLKAHVTELVPSEPPYLLNITCHEKIKAANNAKIVEINELFINFNYSRELEFDAIREFIFLNKEEENVVEIPGFCNFKDKAANVQAGDRNIFFHQFMFYGMTDHFLKEIRIWLLHNHVAQQQK